MLKVHKCKVHGVNMFITDIYINLKLRTPIGDKLEILNFKCQISNLKPQTLLLRARSAIFAPINPFGIRPFVK